MRGSLSNFVCGTQTLNVDFFNEKCPDSGETLAIDSTHVLRSHTKFESHPSTLDSVMESEKSDFDGFCGFGLNWTITRDKFLKPPPNHFR